MILIDRHFFICRIVEILEKQIKKIIPNKNPFWNLTLFLLSSGPFHQTANDTKSKPNETPIIQRQIPLF